MDTPAVTAMPAYSHVHSALASARFDVQDAVWSERRDGVEWAIYLDDSLARWEVYIDAPNGRTFVSSDTWDGLDGVARVAFKDDFISVYRGSDKRELRTLTESVYQAGARRRAMLEGTAYPVGSDRIADLQRRADEAVVAAAGLNQAPSAAQLQVFAMRHAQLVEDLAALEAQVGRLRSAVDLSASALRRATG